ncbi:MAG: hypothetical protein CMO01_08445 [Thalassobius sp.]|nr:hypothetical protein [Thalassovita sp.]
MKILSLFFLLTLSFCISNAQAQSFRGLDKSPLDVAYFPDNFAHDRKEGDEAVMKVTYSRPQKNNREVAGNLIPYGKVWRTGANEATEIKLFKDVTFAGKKLAKGTYSVFSIPGESEWTIIFSSDLDYWGSYKYKESNDVLRVTAKVSKGSKSIEAFTIQFEEDGSSKGVMKMAWDEVLVELPFTY